LKLGQSVRLSRQLALLVAGLHGNTDVGPRGVDVAGVVFAQKCARVGKQAEAASYLIRVIRLNDRSPLGEAAQNDLSRLAETSFRSKLPGRVRPDALEYPMGALRNFATLTPDPVRDIALEIAILGQQGLNPNDPSRDYQLNKLPGRYTGLHLICLMYAATKQLSPDRDIGFDLSAEYSAAKKLCGQTTLGRDGE
jgi:hypothetical protein